MLFASLNKSNKRSNYVPVDLSGAKLMTVYCPPVVNCTEDTAVVSSDGKNKRAGSKIQSGLKNVFNPNTVQHI